MRQNRTPLPTARELHENSRFRAAPRYWDDEDLAPAPRLETPLTCWA